jgi:hypothetical protein
VTSFADVSGWQLEVITDSAKRIVGAVWTGNLAPARFVEFPFVAVNPNTATHVSWPAFQTYANGERVEWTGPEGAKSPASVHRDAAAANAAQSPRGFPGGSRPWHYSSRCSVSVSHCASTIPEPLREVPATRGASVQAAEREDDNRSAVCSQRVHHA